MFINVFPTLLIKYGFYTEVNYLLEWFTSKQNVLNVPEVSTSHGSGLCDTVDVSLVVLRITKKKWLNIKTAILIYVSSPFKTHSNILEYKTFSGKSVIVLSAITTFLVICTVNSYRKKNKTKKILKLPFKRTL